MDRISCSFCVDKTSVYRFGGAPWLACSAVSYHLLRSIFISYPSPPIKALKLREGGHKVCSSDDANFFLFILVSIKPFP